MKPPTDLPALTGLRFLAAGMIFVYHLQGFAPSNSLAALAPGMFHGVSFFFVLSGFVLAHAYHGRNTPPATFYRARIARIVPLHIACMVLLIALLPLPAASGMPLSPGLAAGAFALKLFLLDSWVPIRAATSSWNGVSWSISVELAFYAAFPWLSWAMARRPALTLGSAAALSAALPALAVVSGWPVYAPEADRLTLLQLGTFFPPVRAFEFVLGMAACLVWRRYVAPLSRSRQAWTALEVAICATLALWLVYALPPLLLNTQGPLYVWLRASGSAWLFAPLLMILASGRGWIGRALASPVLVSLGQASFAFYLSQGLILRGLAFYGAPRSALAAFALSLALAYILHIGVETPMRRFLLKFSARARVTPSRYPS